MSLKLLCRLVTIQNWFDIKNTYKCMHNRNENGNEYYYCALKNLLKAKSLFEK
jgi:hypothetical protein